MATARSFSGSSRSFWSSSIPSLGMHGVLLEPTSVVAKAWDHTERIGQRSRSWQPKTLLVTGAGPIGLLAALIGAQRGFDVHVLDHHESLEKKTIVRGLGGTFHLGSLAGPRRAQARYFDGVHRRAERGARRVRPHRIRRHRLSVGVSAPGHEFDVDIGEVNRTMVLDNDTVFGSVNANRAHYEDAVAALRARRQALARPAITRRVPVEQWTQSLTLRSRRH